MRFPGHIKDGKLSLAPLTAQKFREWAAANEGRHVAIIKDESERTLSELRMYRAWLHRVAEQTGNDEDELHEFLIERCAPTAVISVKGPKGSVEVERKKRTSGGHSLTMTAGEMSEFMAKCAALTGYPLPTPEELEAMGYVSNTKSATPSRVEYPTDYKGEPSF